MSINQIFQFILTLVNEHKLISHEKSSFNSFGHFDSYAVYQN